jgi:hypothetical protein
MKPWLRALIAAAAAFGLLMAGWLMGSLVTWLGTFPMGKVLLALMNVGILIAIGVWIYSTLDH